MENKLTIWIHSKYATNLESKLQTRVIREYSLEEEDIYSIEGKGFEFVFDDETGGNIIVQIQNKGETHNIQVTGEFDWEVVTVYQLILDELYKIIQGGVGNENYYIH